MSTEAQEVAVEAPVVEPIATPAPVAETTVVDDKQPAEPKTYTEDELKSQVDAKAAELRNKYERKMEKQRIEQETRAQVLREQQQQQPEAPAKPSSDQFTNYDDYLEALADWKAEQKITQIEQRRQQESESQRQANESKRVQDRTDELLEAGSAKYEDFEDMPRKTAEHLQSKGLTLTRTFTNALLEAENAHDIVAHLAQNLDEAERIAKLPAYAQAKEVGKLEDRLAKKIVKASNAPAPITPIDGGKAVTKKLEDMSYEEMKAHDLKRGARYMR